MLAKGRLLGIQFEGLLENGNYVRECKRAHTMAMRIKEALKTKGYKFKIETFTNQLFPIFPDEKLKELSEKYTFCFIEKVNEKETCVRICTSVLTREENVESLINDL
jgi:threonine aldolase